MQGPGESLPGSIALDNFCRQDGPNKEFTEELKSVLKVTATTGKYWHDWSQLKVLICFRLSQVLEEYNLSHMHVDDSAPQLFRGEPFSDLLDRLLQGLDSFTNGAPFTCQRLCELLLNPKEFYVNLEKLSLAFEKLLLVTSTEPPSTDPYPSHLLSSANETTVEEVADEKVPELLPVNGSHETNGGHQEIKDDEMVDVDGVVDRPQKEKKNAVSEIVSTPSSSTEKTDHEESPNGHVGSSVDKGMEDMAIVDASS